MAGRAVIEPGDPKPQGAGRPPIDVERMLRTHFPQHRFNLSDPVAQENLYDSRTICRFLGIDLGREPVRNETTSSKFRHLLEAHNLCAQLFMLIHDYLEENVMKISRGTIVDATIINAPSLTKNRDGKRDPEMRIRRRAIIGTSA